MSMSPVSDHMMDKRRLMEMLNDTDATIFNSDYLIFLDHRI